MSLNYRGSTTFGRAFKEAIWGRIGRARGAPTSWPPGGISWRPGIADPDLVFLTGWSYGGYITLQAMGVAPGLWAAGLAGIAVADWVSQYDDENELLRAYDRALFGGPPTERMDAYLQASPLTYADRVDAPVLIIQGRHDTRCPARQVELYEARLRALDKPVEVIWFDAGHLGGDVERDIAHTARCSPSRSGSWPNEGQPPPDASKAGAAGALGWGSSARPGRRRSQQGRTVNGHVKVPTRGHGKSPLPGCLRASSGDHLPVTGPRASGSSRPR